ncbi:MAG: PAS domain S-box protein [Spirochaetales bacterium]|nr:PAS domain S-box protein [Spirochaetales bacterium]
MKATENKSGYFQTFQILTMNRMAPGVVIEKDSLTYWRVRILFAIILAGLLISLFAFVPAIALTIKEKLWGLLIIDGVVWLIGINILSSRRLRYEIRAAIALLMFYTLGLVIIIYVGPLSGGPIWLFAFAVLVGVLLGSKAAIMALTVNAITLTITGWLISAGIFGRTFPFFNTMEAMIVAGANFMLLNTIAAISVAVLVKGLISTHQKEEALYSTLQKERLHLIEAKKKLELEVEERLHIEEVLRESEEKHRLLAENTVDCIWQVNLDMECTYINQAVFPFFGYTPEEWIGSKLPEHCSSEEMEKMQTIISNGLANLAKKTTKIFETSLYHKNGEEIPCEITGQIVLDDAGAPIYLQGTTRNITERKRVEKKLKESNDRQRYFHSMTRLMCDNLPDFIWTKDLENKFIFANKACCEKLLNARDTDEPVGKTDMYFAARERESHPENPEYHTFGETCMGSDLVVLKTKKPQRFDEFGNVKGKFLYIDVYKAPFRDENGNLIGTVGCARDITREKKAEEERIKLEAKLQQAQKMEAVGTLAGGIAHDLNNILFPISGYAEMLLQDVPEDSPLRQRLIDILQGTKRAGDLVKQILTFSRQKDHEMKPLKVHLVINEALKLIKSSLPSTIEITQNIKSDCGLVYADPTQIHQIVMNLCTNAYHAMEETGGKLTFNLKEVELAAEDLNDPAMIPGKYVCLTVSDTGPGMEQSITDRIFDPYFTTKEEGKGTGMGLAVVHGVVKSHGGNISVYSEPGKGTEFKVHLPVIKKQEETAKLKTDLPIQKGDERILLVDDEDIIAQMGKQMLERLGYHVTARTGSTDALEAFRENPDKFDLVISDMTMPIMTGEQLAAEIMKIRSDIPIILCTGFSEMMSEEKAKSLGIKGFLMKPVVMKDFSNMIRKVLDKEIVD